MSTALAPASIRWSHFPSDGSLRQGDVRCEVGDCFFACVAVWLNVALRRTLFGAPQLRRCLAAALTWPEVAPLLEILLQELQADLELPRTPTLRRARRLVLLTTTWATHSLMVVLANFCSRLLRCRVGFVVVELTEVGVPREPLQVLPCGQDSLDVACALHHVDGNHYRLLAESRSGAVLFDVPTLQWIRDDHLPHPESAATA
jgi:hypothetical protein